MLVKRVTLFVVYSLLAACAIFQSSSSEPIKSAMDQREYRALILDNGLKVMLVSDATSETAAASLDVFVGSAQNPIDRPGLAHFLEHMLFLGTEKYPKPGEYLAFIKENGGSNNAYTSFEHTNYYFDVKPAALNAALDRFAQFFIAPLLNDDYVEREKHAVDAEFKAGFQSESRRNLDVFQQTMNPANPFSRFSVGSLDTLNSAGTSVREDLQAFYQRYYSADIMALAVLGNEPLDQLEAMVRESFAKVKQFTVDDQTITQPLFDKAQLPLWVSIKPEKNKRSLTLVFALDDQKVHYPDKSLDVIGHILGHEGEGSLLAYLKQRNWAEGLAAGQFIDYRGASAFALTITLTESGVDAQDDILRSVFAVLQRLQQQGIPEWAFDELAIISRLSFDYKDNSTAQHSVTQLANDLQYYPVGDVLRANYRYDSYQPKRVQALLAQMSIDDVYISTVSPKTVPQQESNYYRVPFSVKPLSLELLSSIKNAPLNLTMGLPKRNSLLPESFALKQSAQPQSQPKLIFQQEGIELWFQGLDQFQSPKSVMFLSFQHQAVRQTAEQSAALELYAALLNESLTDVAYPAGMAGLNFNLYANARGLSLKLSGFSDKQAELLLQVLERMQKARFSPQQFERVHAMLTKSWQNQLKQSPYRKLINQIHIDMQPGAWSLEDKLAALAAVDAQQLENYSSYFWQDLNVQALFSGNLLAEQSIASMQAIAALLEHKTSARDALVVRQLADKNLHREVVSEHSDAAYLLYWQAESDSLEDQAYYLLLAKLLESGFFDELRTEQQLGYIVFESYYPLLSVPGLAFVVQSPRVSVNAIHQSVMLYLQQQLGRLGLLSTKQLALYKEAILNDLRQQPKNLQQQADRQWQSLALGYSKFDQREKLALALEAISLESWHKFSQRLSEKPLQRMYLLSTPSAEAITGFKQVKDLPTATEPSPYRFE